MKFLTCGLIVLFMGLTAPCIAQTFQRTRFPESETQDQKKIQDLRSEIDSLWRKLPDPEAESFITDTNKTKIYSLLTKFDRVQQLEETTTSPQIAVRIQLQGTVKSAFQDSESGSTTGQFGAEFSRGLTQYEWTTRVGVASSRSVVTDEFASSLLIPVQGGSTFESGFLQCTHAWRSLDIRKWAWAPKNIPLLACFSHEAPDVELNPNRELYLYSSAGNAEWQYSSGDTEAEPVNDEVSIITTGLGVNFALIPSIHSGTADGNSFGLSGSLGYAYRYVTGIDNITSYESVIGAMQDRFRGLEGGFQVGFNELLGELHLFYFPEWLGNDPNSVIGGWQITAGLSIEIDTFRFTVDDPSR